MSSELLQGRYRITRLLGRGGFGAVYLAADTRLGRRVAIKEVSTAQLPADQREIAAALFEREALTLAQLDHPGLVRVWDYFQQDGRAFLVMEYVDGPSLRDMLVQRRAALPEALVLECGLQLCVVLTYLHSRQPPLIFRDLKPANVMLLGTTDLSQPGSQPDDGELRFKLIDFGIARLFKPEQSSDTLVIGTPGYAPPEQYGQGQTDERSDVYSLGATLHHLLTGRPPQGGNLLPLADLAPHVSPNLARVVERATALDPTLRYPSAEAMRRDLLPIVYSQVPAPPLHVSSQPGDNSQRSPSPTPRPRVPLAPLGTPVRPRQTPSLVLALLVVAVLGVLTVAGIGLHSLAERPASRAQAPTSIAQAPTDAPPAPTPGVRIDWLLPNATGRIAFGQSAGQSLTYDLMIATLDGQPPQQLTRDGASISPAWSADGRLAFASLSGRERQGILAGSLEGRRFDPIGPTNEYARYPAWSPDSSKLAYGSGPDKNGPFKLAIIDLVSGAVTYPGPERVAWISWSRQGLVAYGARQRSDAAQDIFVLSENATPRNVTNSPDQEEDFPDWSPDGRKLAFVSSPAGSSNLPQRQIYVMNANGSGRTQLTQGPGPSTNPVWSPDGTWIAYLSKAGGTTWQVWAMRADGSQPRQLTSGPEQKFYLAWGR